MFIKQVSVFVENKVGRLAAVIEVLTKNNINISALSMADTSEFGILRLIVNEPEKATKALNESGVVTKCTDVLTLAIEDKPGGLLEVLEKLKKENITVEYMYAFVGIRKDGKAIMVMKTDDMQKSLEFTNGHGEMLVTPEDIYRK